MLSKVSVVATTALAPMLWGTTYFVASTFLPPGHPLFTATVRALPAGLVLLAVGGRLPQGAWWWRSVVLGALNIAAFFACLFVVAGRLPGGVAAVVGGIQPILVVVLASRLLGERLRAATIVSGAVGVTGVALIVLRPSAALDPVGVVAALLGACSMAIGVVLSKRWADDVSPLASTAWQLVSGGLILSVLTVVVEPLPDVGFDADTVLGFVYLTLVGTAFAYLVWFRGVAVLPARTPSFLGLLSPVVAVAIGVSIAGEHLAAAQGAGVAMVIGAIGFTVSGAKDTQPSARTPAERDPSGVPASMTCGNGSSSS